MKKFILIVLISIFCINFISAEYPKLTPYVSDFANLLTPEQEQNLNDLITGIEKNTSAEIAIVTVLSTDGEDRVMYANHLGEENGVGKKDKSNGIVVLWSVDNENGGAIAVGRGIESLLNDAKVTRIGRQYRPLFDEGKYYEAFVNITEDLNKELQTQEEVIVTPPNDNSNSNNYWWTYLIIFIAIVYSLTHLRNSNLDNSIEPKKSKRGYKYKKFGKDDDNDDDYSTVVPIVIASSILSSSSSDSDSDSSSSSSNSFGGGSFGGGGGGF